MYTEAWDAAHTCPRALQICKEGVHRLTLDIQTGDYGGFRAVAWNLHLMLHFFHTRGQVENEHLL